MSDRKSIFRLVFLLLLHVGASPVLAQENGALGEADALRRYHPDVLELIERLELAQGVAFGGLALEGDAVRASGSDVPTFGFEFEMVDRLTFLVQGEGGPEDAAAAAAGFEQLGPRGAEIVRWGYAFEREVLSILADPGIDDKSKALDAAVATYRSRPEVALPDVPKDMDILYDHTYGLQFRGGYADLTGLLWAGHWFRLAVTEPLTDIPPGDERVEGIDTVTTRYFAKLSYGEPPEFFPSEIPLAPAISPGLIWLSPESAMIWDNLSLMLEVIGDVLAAPEAHDVPTALEATYDFFLDPEQAVTDQDEWEIMALRHGIFFQGGMPLTVMTESELNADGHAAHLSGGAGGSALTIPGMPRR